MSSPSSKQTAKQLNAYAIFLILERQRNLKLRELYRNKQVVDTPLLPVISEEESSASSTATTTTTRTSSLRQAIKMKKKCEATSSSCMSTLPKFPPRYQALASIITSDVLMMQLRTTTPTSPRGSSHQRSPSSHPTPSSSSSYLEEYKNLDQSTKRFLNDTVKIIQDRYNEEVENNETKLEIIDVRRRSSSRRAAKVVGSKKLFAFRVEKKLSLIVD